jgi:hypothetical protein
MTTMSGIFPRGNPVGSTDEAAELRSFVRYLDSCLLISQIIQTIPTPSYGYSMAFPGQPFILPNITLQSVTLDDCPRWPAEQTTLDGTVRTAVGIKEHVGCCPIFLAVATEGLLHVCAGKDRQENPPC